MPIWEAAPMEDERMRPVLNRIDDLRRAELTSRTITLRDIPCNPHMGRRP